MEDARPLPSVASTPWKVEFTHFPVLDGLRGIAVLCVMAYHMEFLAPELKIFVKGGFLGVDIFFVLSGFLITSILLREHDRSGKISLKNFYIRRTLRLMPALWLFLTVLYFGGNFLLPPKQAEIIYSNNNFLYSIFYLTNWQRATGAVTGNLNHIWSLAIEEQFYIIWSLVLFKAFGESRSRKQIAVGTFIVVTVLVMQRAIRAAMGSEVDVLYYSTDTRIDALLIGCLASMVYCWRLIPEVFFQSVAFKRIALGSAICALALLSIFAHGDITLYFGFISLFSLSVAVAILWLITRRGTIAHRLLETSMLRWLGGISYGLYLWHYVFYEFAKSRFDGLPLQMFVGVGLALIAASLSFYCIERPLLHFKERLCKPAVPGGALPKFEIT